MGNNIVYNRLIISIALMILVPAIVVIMVVAVNGGNRLITDSDEARSRYMSEYAEKLNQRNADIIFYKRSPNGPENLKARRVNALNDKGLALNLHTDSAYHVLIINDLDGTNALDDQDVQKIKDLLYNQHFRIIYLGTVQYQKLAKEGILNASAKHKEGTKTYLTYFNSSNMHSHAEGFADDPSSVPSQNGLTGEQVIINTVIVELARKDLYWN